MRSLAMAAFAAFLGWTGQDPAISPTEAPPGVGAQSVRWVKIDAPGVGVMTAAVASPPGRGPFPAVLLLHGTHGFALDYVQLAQELANGGLTVVAPCWFAGGGGAGAGALRVPIACPGAPQMPMALSTAALRIVGALVRATRSLPEVRADRIGLAGHSRGAGASLNYASSAGDVSAVVLDSSGYDDTSADLAAQVTAPILILHGVADAPGQGGSNFTAIGRARAFEAARRRVGRPVEAHYYERGEHNSIFSDAAQHEDAVKRMVAFLRRELLP